MHTNSPTPSGRRSRHRLVAIGAIAGLAIGSAAAVTSSAAAAATAGFAAGDVVVYRVGTGAAALTSASTAVSLDEYTPSGSVVQSVALPTAASGANNPLTASGTAGSEGLLTLSADGRYLVATGYDATPGTAGVSGSAATAVPRTIARVGASDTVDTTTALTDFATGNNPRSAVSNDGNEFWVSGAAGGVRYATLGATTSTQLTSTAVNLRQVGIAGGQLYVSGDSTKAGGTTVATVGSGLPTSGTQQVTNLISASASPEPYGYSLLTLGSGTTPDTLYVGDQTKGAIAKYSLVNGSWTATGSVPLSGVEGVTANDVKGVVTVYATTGSGLYSITDSSGAGGTLSGTPTQLATAPANTAFRGVAFAPGTTIGSGGTPPSNPPPTITAAAAGLPAALGDPTVPSTTLTVASGSYDPSQLTVTGTSSNQNVAADSGISITGTGATRTLAVSPAGAVGDATITLTVTAPDNTSSTTSVTFAASQNVNQAGAHYYSGAGNASAAVDVGDGYAIVGDDESNVLRLYDLNRSGPPVATFDFTPLLPYGTQEIDIEAAARRGNTIYWSGSMSNSSSGTVEPSRSTIFATTLSGSGANATLTYAGAYTGLRSDLITWDQANGNPLGLAASGASGVGAHQNNAFNMEGMEFAGSTGTLYLAFRAPLESPSTRTRALLVPLTDLTTDIAAGSGVTGDSTFGNAVQLNLGGLGFRDIKENADGQYLIAAGTADDSNTGFVLYYWDGNPADDPQPTGTTLPQLPSANNAGSWETVVSVPDPLTSGATVQLIQDDGDVVWYGDGLTSKNGLLPDLQKSLGVAFTYQPPAPRASTTSLTGPASTPAGQSVTYTATVAPASGNGTPTGSVDFQDDGNDITGCSSQPVAAGQATCTVTYTATGSHPVTATYGGDGTYSGSTSATLTHAVTAGPVDHLVLSPASTSTTAGTAVTYTAEGYDSYGNDLGDVTSATTFTIAPGSGTAGSGGASCSAAGCSATTAGGYTVTGTDGSATGTATLQVTAGPVATLTLAPADATTRAGTAVAYTAAGYDAYGNPTGDETGAATFGILASSGSNTGAGCSGASCSATAAGDYVVSASVPTTNGTASGSTALTVTAGPLATLTLSPANAEVAAGQSQAYTAHGADAYGNSLGDVTGATTFGIDGAGTCSGSSCSASAPGTYTITGTDGSVIGTARLSVAAPPAAPAVSGVSPDSGPTTGGTTVTVTGSGFAGATGVAFGSVAATGLTVVSDTQLTVQAPADTAGLVDVRVTGPYGTSAATTTDRYTYTAPARPAVTSVSPSSGPASGGTTVTVTGTDLTGASSVDFGGAVSRNVTVVSPTRLRVVTPAHPAGTVAVRVVTPGGTSPDAGRDRYRYLPLTPAVSALSPGRGTTRGGTTVTISGAGFTGTVRVEFGNSPARRVRVVSDGRLVVVTPAHGAGRVAVRVVTRTGRSTGRPQFTFAAPRPAVTSLSRSAGPERGGTTITIRGDGLTGTRTVRFGRVAAHRFTVLSDRRIRVVVPRHPRGRCRVTVTGPGGTSRATRRDDYTYRT